MPNRNRIDPAEIANWEALLDEGYGYKHVAEVYHVGHKTVRKYLPGRGWTHAQILEQAALTKRLKRIKVMC